MLDAIPNGAGGTLLDSTALVWLGELSDGNHGHKPVHYVIVGGANGQFKTGRYLRYPESLTVGGRRMGKGHNHMLVSLARAMGVDTEAIGARNLGGVNLTGPLTELAG